MATTKAKGKRGNGNHQLLLWGGGGLAALVVAGLVIRSSSSSSGPSSSSNATDNAILAANLNAMQTQAGENVALAGDRVQTYQAKLGLDALMNQDQTAIAIASHNGATQIELQKLADTATIKAALIGKAEQIALGAQQESTQKYQALEGYKGVASQSAAASTVGTAEAAAQSTAAQYAAAASEASSASNTAVAQAQATAAQNTATTQSNNNLFGTIFGGILNLFGGGLL